MRGLHSRRPETALPAADQTDRVELRDRHSWRMGGGAISLHPALPVGHGAQSRRRVRCALRPYRPHGPEPFRYLLDAAHGKMVAASHRREACRGASNPRNGRHPASRLTPNARPRRENPVGDDRFQKTEILARLYDGDTHVAPELRAKVRDRMAVEADAPPVVARTVGELCARAHAVGLAREQAAAEKLAAERKRQVEEAEKA